MKKTLLFSLVALGSVAYAQKKPLIATRKFTKK
jgi:hypothetical protein